MLCAGIRSLPTPHSKTVEDAITQGKLTGKWRKKGICSDGGAGDGGWGLDLGFSWGFFFWSFSDIFFGGLRIGG